MKLKLLYFASLRETLGIASESIEWPGDRPTIAALREHLAQRGGAWSTAFSAPRLRAAVNQDLAGPEGSVKEGDEIAFFPPVTGG